MSSNTPISVLIVDDVPLIRDAVKLLLTQGDYAKIAGEAENGQEAVSMADKGTMDIILMDIDMPVMNGIEAAKAIREKNKDIKIVMLTSCNSESFIFNSFAAGADGYVLKDKFPATMQAAITTVRLGSVWLDPAIARRILELAGDSKSNKDDFESCLTRQELDTLNTVACDGGHCLVAPEFVANLRRLTPARSA